MSVLAWNRARQLPYEWTVIAPTAIFVLISGFWLAIQYTQLGAVHLEDDAYYYTIIANNIARSGISTFDGQTLTNGYHPLWLLLLVAQDLTFGSSPGITIVIELLLASAGLWFFLASFRTDSVLFRVIFVVLYALLTRRIIEKGMEVSLLLFGLGLFTRLAVQHRKGKDNSLALGFAAIFCIGARLDSAVFVLPVVGLVCGGIRRSLPALVPVAVAGAVYAGVNLWIFGLAFPISGAIKSLGGLQLNHRLIAEAFVPGSSGLRQIIAFPNSIIGRPLLIFILSGLGLVLVKRDWKSWPLCVGFLIGFVLFAVKLTAFSSWLIWPWYSFPEVIGLVVLFHIADDYLSTTKFEANPRLEIAVSLILLLGVGVQTRAAGLHAALISETENFDAVNFDAVTKFGPIFNGARVAMGDRAGSFAANYNGPVTQLEGLVNDRRYLEALRGHEDIKPLLCARGVRYVLSFQRDLGAYQKIIVPVLRSHLTQFSGPTLTFSRADEVGSVFDLTKFDNSAADEGDNYLYAWRLSGCGGVAGSS